MLQAFMRALVCRMIGHLDHLYEYRTQSSATLQCQRCFRLLEIE